MPTLLKRIFKREAATDLQARVYAEIVAQARRPWPYEVLGVPDTLDGRFDMLILHAFLVFDRLREGDERAHAFSQAVFEGMFKNLDHTLREMGVGDMSVGKRIRKMGEIFYGRSAAYEAALREPDVTALADVLARNVFAGEPPAGSAASLADYVIRQRKWLERQPVSSILAGELAFDQESAEKPNARET